MWESKIFQSELCKAVPLLHYVPTLVSVSTNLDHPKCLNSKYI